MTSSHVCDLAPSSGGETRCRTEAAENHPSLRGALAEVEREGDRGAAHRSPSSSSEERAESPGLAEGQAEKRERREGTEAVTPAFVIRGYVVFIARSVVAGP